jgi:hypothetical protein
VSPRRIPASDLHERAIGTGSPLSQSKRAGKQRATWSSIDLTGGGAVVGTVKEYDVPHDLKEIPTVVELGHYERSGGPVTITARGVRMSNWSHSHVHVEVTLHAGSLDGTRASFLVKGK